MKKVIIAGNALTARIIYAYLQADLRYQVVGTVVDDEFVQHNLLENVPCFKFSELGLHFSPEAYTVIMAMGYSNLNRSRESLFKRLQALGYIFETYIHPDAKVYTDFDIGAGSLILPGAVIEPMVKIGLNTVIWSNCTIAHHSTVGDNCWIASGAILSGQASVANNSFVGVGAIISNQVAIEAYNIVGAGAMMSKCTAAYDVHLARSGEPFRYNSEDYIKFFGMI